MDLLQKHARFGMKWLGRQLADAATAKRFRQGLAQDGLAGDWKKIVGGAEALGFYVGSLYGAKKVMDFLTPQVKKASAPANNFQLAEMLQSIGGDLSSVICVEK